MLWQKSQLVSSTLYDCMRAAKMEQREDEISVKKNMKTESVEPSPMRKERAYQTLLGKPNMNDEDS